MGGIKDGFDSAFRDYNTDGVPGSGAHEPVKSEIRAIAPVIETTIGSAIAGANRYATVAAMTADTDEADGKLGYVFKNNGSTTDPLNGYYQWDDVGNVWEPAPWVFADIAAAAQPFLDAAAFDADRAEAAANLAGTTWTPLDLGSALVAWYDMGDASTRFTARAGTGALAYPGGVLGHIKDKSVNGYHWSAFNDAGRPAVGVTSEGRTFATFDGVDDWGLSLPFAAPLAQPFSRYSCIRPRTWTGAQTFFDGGAGAQIARLAQQSSEPNYTLNAGAIAILSGDRRTGECVVFKELFNGATSKLAQDEFPPVIGNAGTNTLARARMGGRNSGSDTACDQFANFDFFGQIICNRALTDAEELLVESFFNKRRTFQNLKVTTDYVGDSLTAGTGATTAAARYPARVAARLGANYASTNRGVPSQRSDNIAARVDAIPFTISLAGNLVPATGSVSATVVAPINGAFPQSQQGPLGFMSNTSLACVLTTDNGTLVRGFFTVAAGGVYTFVRYGDGEPLAVSPGATVHILQHYRNAMRRVIWAGRNNLTEARVITDIAAIVAVSRDHIVLGITNSRGGTEDAGSVNHNAMLARNATLAATYGTRFINIYDYLRDTSGAGPYVALGLSSAGDAADIDAGRIGATWVSGDNLHFNDNGYDAISLVVSAKQTALGWTTP